MKNSSETKVCWTDLLDGAPPDVAEEIQLVIRRLQGAPVGGKFLGNHPGWQDTKNSGPRDPDLGFHCGEVDEALPKLKMHTKPRIHAPVESLVERGRLLIGVTGMIEDKGGQISYDGFQAVAGKLRKSDSWVDARFLKMWFNVCKDDAERIRLMEDEVFKMENEKLTLDLLSDWIVNAKSVQSISTALDVSEFLGFSLDSDRFLQFLYDSDSAEQRMNVIYALELVAPFWPHEDTSEFFDKWEKKYLISEEDRLLKHGCRDRVFGHFHGDLPSPDDGQVIPRFYSDRLKEESATLGELKAHYDSIGEGTEFVRFIGSLRKFRVGRAFRNKYGLNEDFDFERVVLMRDIQGVIHALHFEIKHGGLSKTKIRKLDDFLGRAVRLKKNFPQSS